MFPPGVRTGIGKSIPAVQDSSSPGSTAPSEVITSLLLWQEYAIDSEL